MLCPSKGNMKSNLFTAPVLFVVTVLIDLQRTTVIAAPHKNAQLQEEIIEGDIMVTESLRHVIKAGNSRAKRDIVSEMVKRWPDGVVPYKLDSSLSKDAVTVTRKAIREFHHRTCVKFVPHTNEEDYVVFEGNFGCFSAIGRQGGKQRISVGEGCEFKGTVMHEMMHALGFFHEQSRSDRDDYVMVLWWNIEPGFEKNFDSYGPDRLDSAEEPYDFESLMHYDNFAFSKNGQNTLQSISDPDKTLGNMEDFSEIDIKQLLKDYPCKPWDRQPSHKKENQKNKTQSGKRNCQDLFKEKCEQFASYEGYCGHWKKFMRKWCPKSCGFCKTESAGKRLNIWRAENTAK